MADPAILKRLSLADHVLIHTLGYLSIEQPHETWEVFLRELDDVLPRVSMDHPRVAELAAAARALIEAGDDRARTAARGPAERLIGAWHQSRAAAAIEALRQADSEAKTGGKQDV